MGKSAPSVDSERVTLIATCADAADRPVFTIAAAANGR
jgi:hypothetical protein